MTAVVICLLFTCLALIQVGSGLRCRVEHDERTQEGFRDVVRACMGVNFQDEQMNRPHNNNNNNNNNKWQQRPQWGYGIPRFPTKENSEGNDQREDSENGQENSRDSGYNNNNNRGNTNRRSGYKPRSSQGSSLSSSGLFGSRTGSNHTSRSQQNNGSPLEEVEPCVIHCMFRQLKMLDRNNQLDKAATESAMTSKLRDPELKEFIRDSISECFDIMDSETQDTNCAFSKSFAMCLEQKGQQNCEDWDDPIRPPKQNQGGMSFNKHRG